MGEPLGWRSTCVVCLDAASHTRHVPSSEEDVTRSPSAEHAIAVTARAWPSSVAAPNPAGAIRRTVDPTRPGALEAGAGNRRDGVQRHLEHAPVRRARVQRALAGVQRDAASAAGNATERSRCPAERPELARAVGGGGRDEPRAAGAARGPAPHGE